MSAGRATGGVRGLAAMFENQQQSSPNARGRSPAGGSNGDNIRPLSRVRTSFVPVEQRASRNHTPDTNASTPHRRVSDKLEEESLERPEYLEFSAKMKKLGRDGSHEEFMKAMDEGAAESHAKEEKEGRLKEAASHTDRNTVSAKLDDSPFPAQTNVEATLNSGEGSTSGNAVVELAGKAPVSTSSSPLETMADPFVSSSATTSTPGSAETGMSSSVASSAVGGKTNGKSSNVEASHFVNGQAESTRTPSGSGNPTNLPSNEAVSSVSPPPEHVLQTLAEQLRTPTIRSSQQSSNGHIRSPFPTTPTPAPKNATPRAGPTVRNTPIRDRPSAPEPHDRPAAPEPRQPPSAPEPHSRPSAPEPSGRATVRAQQATKSPIVSPATQKPTAEAAIAASPATTDSTTSRAQSTPRGGRLSVASRRGGTVTTGGFIKPRPRSPTRPVQLPAHLIAPTASSAAKQGSTPPQESRTLTRRASTISDRNSLGRSMHGTVSRRPAMRPATTQQTHRPTPSPARGPPRLPDDSFLARMMRPTASSASKVREGGSLKANESLRRRPTAATRPKTNGTAAKNGNGHERAAEPATEEGNDD